jgi:3-methyladenine DNA glycosylase AlkD
MGHVEPSRSSGEGLTRGVGLPDVETVLAELKALGSEEGRAGMARFGIDVERAFGVPMAAQRPLQRKYRCDHELAAELWKTGYHEARILAALIDDPKQVTSRQMDNWAADFNSWDLCDQACMKLFAKTSLVAEKVKKWAEDEREFVRRAAFATMAGYAVHAKDVPDSAFLPFLDIIERHATDKRNFVRKAVNWALRQIGKRSKALHKPALALSRKLAASDDSTARWIGKDAARELTDPAQVARIEGGKLPVGQPI